MIDFVCVIGSMKNERSPRYHDVEIQRVVWKRLAFDVAKSQQSEYSMYMYHDQPNSMVPVLSSKEENAAADSSALEAARTEQTIQQLFLVTSYVVNAKSYLSSQFCRVA